MKPKAHPQNEEYCPVAIYNLSKRGRGSEGERERRREGERERERETEREGERERERKTERQRERLEAKRPSVNVVRNNCLPSDSQVVGKEGKRWALT